MRALSMGYCRRGFLLALAALSFGSTRSVAAPHEQEFVSWVTASLVPLNGGQEDVNAGLDALGRLIGDARIVVLGEGAHGAAQPLEFRNRLFRYLVEKKGFTAIAVESGVVEGRVVNDYVLGGAGEIDDILARGYSWTMAEFPQNKALVEWMRSYNQGHSGGTKLSFWGFDIPGSPGNRFARRGVQTALDESLGYLHQVDPWEAAKIEAGLQGLLPLSLNSYGMLPKPDRDRLTSSVNRIAEVMRERRRSYVSGGTRAQYDWAYRSAQGARQVDEWLRPIPLGWKPQDGFAWTEKSLVPRHEAMVDNLDWIFKQLRRGQRILLFSALSHVATSPLQLSDAAGLQVPAGIEFRRRFGGRMVTIGNIVSDGQIGNCGSAPLMQLKPPPEGSLSSLLGKLGVSEFILDLRHPPRGALAYLSGPRELWNGFASMSLEVPKAFDIAHFSGPLVPACSAADK